MAGCAPSDSVAAAAESRPVSSELTAKTREGASLALGWLPMPHAMERAVMAPCNPVLRNGATCSTTSDTGDACIGAREKRHRTSSAYLLLPRVSACMADPDNEQTSHPTTENTTLVQGPVMVAVCSCCATSVYSASHFHIAKLATNA